MPDSKKKYGMTNKSAKIEKYITRTMLVISEFVLILILIKSLTK